MTPIFYLLFYIFCSHVLYLVCRTIDFRLDPPTESPDLEEEAKNWLICVGFPPLSLYYLLTTLGVPQWFARLNYRICYFCSGVENLDNLTKVVFAAQELQKRNEELMKENEELRAIIDGSDELEEIDEG